MPLVNGTENTHLDSLFSSTVYVGWSTTVPTKAGGNVTEPTGGGYARISTSPSDWTDAATGALTNANAIVGDPATDTQGTPASILLYTVASGGTPFAYSTSVTGAESVDSGEAIRIAAGALDVEYVQS